MNPLKIHPHLSDASSISSTNISVKYELLPPPPPAPNPTILEILQQNQHIIQILGITMQSLTPTQPSTVLPL